MFSIFSLRALPKQFMGIKYTQSHPPVVRDGDFIPWLETATSSRRRFCVICLWRKRGQLPRVASLCQPPVKNFIDTLLQLFPHGQVDRTELKNALESWHNTTEHMVSAASSADFASYVTKQANAAPLFLLSVCYEFVLFVVVYGCCCLFLLSFFCVSPFVISHTLPN